MKAEDITEKHTRKEMNVMAKDLDIENPESFSSKKELADEMITVMENDVYNEKIEDKIDEVKDLLKKARKIEVDIGPFKEEFTRMTKAKKDENMSETYRMALDLTEMGENLISADEKIEGIRESIDEISEEARTDLEEKLDDAIERFEKGDYSERLEELDQIDEEIQEILDKREELDEKLKEAKKKLSDLRKSHVKIDNIKKIIQSAVENKKKKRYEEGLEKIEGFWDQADSILEISEKIDEVKSKIKEIKEENLDYENYKDLLLKGKEKADEGEYQYSRELLNDAVREMDEDLDEERKEEKMEEEKREELEDILESVEELEEDARKLKERLQNFLD